MSLPRRENILEREWREVSPGRCISPRPGSVRGAAVTIVTADFGVRR